jgi:uncharacterized protein
MGSDETINIGPYREARYISSGSFADAYKVVDLNGIDGVLKWLRKDVKDQVGTPRFRNEAWALSKLNHKSIPKLIDQNTADGRPYIVMSLFPGFSLRRRLSVPVGERGTFGEKVVLRILDALLDAVCHMQKHDITHRDIKDDNVICNDDFSSIGLVDFGFCKGETQPADTDSFLQVGAPRYSSPSKLRFPSKSHPSHDVFAIGVLGYLLLTNRYPWTVDHSDDFGILADAMEDISPINITDLNSVVSYDTSQLIATLIQPSDDKRISPESAQKYIKQIQKIAHEKLRFPAFYSEFFPKVTRDSVHGDIRCTSNEFNIIDTPEFQRLRSLKQLGFGNLSYYGAEHSRLSHSIGTMHVADKIIQSIYSSSGNRIEPEERQLVRTYALVHDMTHIPFGHTLEDELGFFTRHDQNVERIERIFFSQKAIAARILKKTAFGRIILDDMLDRKSTRLMFARDVVEGPLGADVIDYIDRDSLYCGVDHNTDSAIYRHFRSELFGIGNSSPTQHLVSKLFGSRGFRRDAEFAIESLLLQRFALFMKVYMHPAKVSAGAMLGKAISYFDNTLLQELELISESFGDESMLNWIFEKGSTKAKKLVSCIRARELYKPTYFSYLLQDAQLNTETYNLECKRLADEFDIFSPFGRKNVESKLAKDAGVSDNDIILYCPEKPPGLQKVFYYTQRQKDEMPSASASESNRRMVQRHLGLWSAYIFTPPGMDSNKKATIAARASEIFGRGNNIGTGVR